MNKHTAGPWNRIIADGHTVRHPQIYSDTGPVANATWLGDGRVDELNANARLIAAAPDLLAALEALLDYENGIQKAIAEQMACAAIKKAMGQS